MRLLKLPSFVTILVLGLLLGGCLAVREIPQKTAVIPTNPTGTVLAGATQARPTTTATQVASRSLVLCVQDEPQTLYLYGGNSTSMWSVLEAVYDGPFDTRNYGLQPVILSAIPSRTAGDADVQAVPVKSGDIVVNTDGNLVALQSGVKVFPAGCSDSSCAATWDGKSALSMDQLVVKFKLLPGLKWSDGAPLNAADSVYSYTLAADPATPASKYLTDRTITYKALDDLTVEWKGVPGFYEQRFGTLFWLPLPKHTMSSLSAKDLLTNQAVNRAPLGWGPYVIQEWAAGDHITLRKNPHYFRAAEGLPKFDTLVYRFIGETADGNMNSLLSGECDAIDQNPQFLEMFPGLVQRETDKKLTTYVGQGPEWEHLDFGIVPAAYDNTAAPRIRPDFFGDARTRQAFAECIDRASINQTLLYGRALVPNSYVPPNHPLYQKDLPAYAYNPGEAAKLLDAVGWKDTDNNPSTPRVAVGVKGVPDGTAFTITYLTTQAKLRGQTAQDVAASLKGCGIQATVKTMNPGDLFGPGPDGVVFGRNFDVVQFSWQASPNPNCALYTTAQIPNAQNQWIGANVSGYSSAEFDAACAASGSQANDPVSAAQKIFAKDLPVIPLYTDLKIAISRPDLCGLSMDVTARSIFWNIEALDYGKDCKK